MILFYNEDTGSIFSVIDGRVHDELALSNFVVDSNNPKEKVGKYIIGWIDGINGKIAYNLDKFDILQKFEDITPESPLDYKVDIETGNLVKFDRTL